MEELKTTAEEAMIRLTADEVVLLLSAMNETLEALEDWEFSTRTGFEKNEFRALQAELSVVRNRMIEER